MTNAITATPYETRVRMRRIISPHECFQERRVDNFQPLFDPSLPFFGCGFHFKVNETYG